MRVTYYALKKVAVGDGERHPGDLVPEAAGWPHLNAYVQDGTVAPVLVVTLPQEVQDLLEEWENGPAPKEPEVPEEKIVDIIEKQGTEETKDEGGQQPNTPEADAAVLATAGKTPAAPKEKQK